VRWCVHSCVTWNGGSAPPAYKLTKTPFFLGAHGICVEKNFLCRHTCCQTNTNEEEFLCVALSNGAPTCYTQEEAEQEEPGAWLRSKEEMAERPAHICPLGQ